MWLYLGNQNPRNMKHLGLPLLIILVILGIIFSYTSGKKKISDKREKSEIEQREKEKKSHTFDQFEQTKFGAYVTSLSCADTIYLYANRNSIVSLTFKY